LFEIEFVQETLRSRSKRRLHVNMCMEYISWNVNANFSNSEILAHDQVFPINT